MKKLLFASLFCVNFLFADYLFQPSNLCIKEYWYKDGNFYFIRSDTGAVASTFTTNLGDDVYGGYDYNTTTGECTPKSSNNDLGLSSEDFEYLNALIGLLIAILMLWSLFA
ncbi:hypothetical protein [Sulfurospirillum barnesii]|uniref:Uncharacterized protein n=1 Tax=Sulfurospirillum barnesii (strain ATCC 700032 / DSM 10660 / SES-3) TaxID=760154 RepID=I3XWE5_SULBS|nr:hypothetical protein [Sulfurospirillum barnesii]AFL68269.1 hypothetical protein Sulba_0968 [Sulfurospirillum barnesii SES-3]